MFPIHRDCAGREILRSLPYEVVVRYSERLHTNHRQSIETLARRGGCSCSELLAAVWDIDWPELHEVYRKDDVRAAQELLRQLMSPLPSPAEAQHERKREVRD